MGRRVARVLGLTALVLALVAALGAPLASGEEEDHPVGYTFGAFIRGVPRTGCDFFKVDLTTAVMTRVNSAPVPCGDGLTFDDDGTLYAFSTPPSAGPGPIANLVTIDKKTGAQHIVGSLPPVNVGGAGMTFDADGHLWLYAYTAANPQCASSGGPYCLWKVDPDTAQSTFVGSNPRGVFGLTADCEDVLGISARVVGGSATPRVELDEVHTSTGALEKIVDLPGIGFPSGLDFDADHDLWAVGEAGLGGAGIGPTLWRIDPTDGTTQAKDLVLNGAPFGGFVNGLGIASIDCEDPGPEPAPTPTPAPVVVAPTFTG